MDGIGRFLRRGHLRGDRRGEEEAGDGGAPQDGGAQAGGRRRGADLPDAGVRAGVREARAPRGAAAPHPRGFRGPGAVRKREEHAPHPALPGDRPDRQRERHGGHRGDPAGGRRGGGERSPGDPGDPDDRGGPADPAHRQRRALHEGSPPAPRRPSHPDRAGHRRRVDPGRRRPAHFRGRDRGDGVEDPRSAGPVGVRGTGRHRLGTLQEVGPRRARGKGRGDAHPAASRREAFEPKDVDRVRPPLPRDRSGGRRRAEGTIGGGEEPPARGSDRRPGTVPSGGRCLHRRPPWARLRAGDRPVGQRPGGPGKGKAQRGGPHPPRAGDPGRGRPPRRPDDPAASGASESRKGAAPR